ncbi:MAG: alpha/beta hydrolase family protein [Verrucomicrobiota bacterium]
MPAFLLTSAILLSAQELPGTKPLTMQGDLSAQMVAGIDKFLLREIDNSIAARQQHWKRDFSSPEAYEKSVAPNRERFRKYIGAVDARVPAGALEFVSTTAQPSRIAETDRYVVHAVRWQVFSQVYGEGLLLQPRGELKAHIIALPDADQTPEMLAGLVPGMPPDAQFARRLAESGCLVVVPALVDRQAVWSGNARVGRFTNQPHREWIYRQAFELGRHVIGYEVQKVLALVDSFSAAAAPARIGVAGYGEGALVGLYAAAIDTRINAAVVSGYFDSRQRVWEEPIYRNVFTLLKEFGDAEIASLIAPRTLVIEHSQTPTIQGPPAPGQGRGGGAAPGKWATPDFTAVETEFQRAQKLCGAFSEKLKFIYGTEGSTTGPGSTRALNAFLTALGAPQLSVSGLARTDARKDFDPAPRQQRQIQQLENHTQRLLELCEYGRADFLWNKVKPATPEAWAAAMKSYKEIFAKEVIGDLPAPSIPPNPRSRKIKETEKWTAYEVVLDVWPDVYAWGYLLLPKDLKPGEKRPVVVCQHGLEGVPEDVINEDEKSRAYGPYKAFAARLAERGFITFAPHNPYRGQDKFRVLQRKLNPLGKTLFSVIIPQHQRIVDWLAEQPFADPKRIAFYGLSYGGKTAMRVPPLVEGYCLSICSGDFNEWVWKNATVDWRGSYMFTGEYEIFEWDLGHTFNYAEMAALIAPRPFMVERGHNDGVGIDERVAYEYAKVKRLYDFLGIGERTEIEYFNGPHTINGKGAYDFLHTHLNWPKR